MGQGFRSDLASNSGLGSLMKLNHILAWATYSPPQATLELEDLLPT